MRIPLPTLLCAAAILAACDVRVGEDGVSMGVSAGKATDTWQRTYDLPPGGRFELAADGGPVTVTGSDAAQVEVRILLEARAPSDEAAAAAVKEVTIDETVAAEAVRVETRLPGGRRGAGMGRPRVSHAIEVRLPRGLVSTFRTQNGAVRIERVDGRIAVSTTNGAIHGSDLSGAVDAAAVNGAVQLDMAVLTGAMQLSVVNGALRLELPRDVKAEVAATAVNGSVTVGDGLTLVEPGGSGAAVRAGSRVNGTINGGGPRISAVATNGSVRIAARGGEIRPRKSPS
jgi:hypothetical protein